MTIGDVMDTETGNMSGPARQGFDNRIGTNADGVNDDLEPNVIGNNASSGISLFNFAYYRPHGQGEGRGLFGEPQILQHHVGGEAGLIIAVCGRCRHRWGPGCPRDRGSSW